MRSSPGALGLRQCDGLCHQLAGGATIRLNAWLSPKSVLIMSDQVNCGCRVAPFQKTEPCIQTCPDYPPLNSCCGSTSFCCFILSASLTLSSLASVCFMMRFWSFNTQAFYMSAKTSCATLKVFVQCYQSAWRIRQKLYPEDQVTANTIHRHWTYRTKMNSLQLKILSVGLTEFFNWADLCCFASWWSLILTGLMVSFNFFKIFWYLCCKHQ